MPCNFVGINSLEQVKRAIAICKKDVRIYYYKGPAIIFGILLPLFLFAAFLIGRALPAPFLVSRLMAMTVFFTATAVVPMIMPWETRAKTLERLVSAPVSVATIVLGDILASFLFGALFSMVPLILGLALNVAIAHPAALLVGTLLASFCFSSLGAILSAPPEDVPANVMMLSSLVKFPLLFASGVFIPLGNLPAWGRVIAALSPLTYFTDIAAYSIEGVGYYPISFNFAILCSFTLFLSVAAMKLHETNMPKRL